MSFDPLPQGFFWTPRPLYAVEGNYIAKSEPLPFSRSTPYKFIPPPDTLVRIVALQIQFGVEVAGEGRTMEAALVREAITYATVKWEAKTTTTKQALSTIFSSPSPAAPFTVGNVTVVGIPEFMLDNSFSFSVVALSTKAGDEWVKVNLVTELFPITTEHGPKPVRDEPRRAPHR